MLSRANKIELIHNEQVTDPNETWERYLVRIGIVSALAKGEFYPIPISRIMNKAILCVFGAIVAGAVSAFAIPSSLSVDLRSTAWSSASGAVQDTVGGVTASAAFPPGSVLTWSSTAGLGINAPGLLALSPTDIMNVSFANGSGTGLTGAWATNLFSGTSETGILELVTTTGTDVFDFSGSSSGDVFVNFGGALNVLTAEFVELNPTGQLFSKGYSVAGFTKVPDGGTTLTLLGIVLISFMAVRRRLAL